MCNKLQFHHKPGLQICLQTKSHVNPMCWKCIKYWIWMTMSTVLQVPSNYGSFLFWVAHNWGEAIYLGISTKQTLESDTHILTRAVQSQLREYKNLKNNVRTFVILFLPNFDIKVRHSTILIKNIIYFVWNTFTLLLLTFNNSIVWQHHE